MKRRTYLAALSASVVTLSGCSVSSDSPGTTQPPSESPTTQSVSSTPQSGSPTPSLTAPPLQQDAVLATEKLSLDTPPKNPIRVSDLPADERQIVKEAIQNGVYHRCGNESMTTLESFRERVISQPPGEEYLAYNNEYYGILLRFSDVYSATTAPLPDGNKLKDCG